jgi:hypothetical protein
MRKALLLAVTLPLLAVASPADAVRVRTCVSTVDLTFSPPLTLDPHSGTITWGYTNTCVVAYDNGASGVDTYSNSLTFGYSGSCATAVLTGSGGQTGVLVGGTVATMVAGPSFVRAAAWVLVPDSLNPCAMSSASGVGVGPDVLL